MNTGTHVEPLGTNAAQNPPRPLGAQLTRKVTIEHINKLETGNHKL